MPPEIRVVPRFAAEPSQELLPYGRWAERLQEELLAACLRIDPGEDGELGELGDITWYPDRTWHGRTYVPATARTTTGLEVFGHVSYARADADREPSAFHAVADATSETADANPDWTIDLCDEVIGTWRGEEGNVAAMTLVWGRPLVDGRGDRDGRARRPVRRPVAGARRPLHADRARRLPRRHARRGARASAAGASSRASRSTPRTTRTSPRRRWSAEPRVDVDDAIRTRRTHKAYRPEPVDRGRARGAARPRALGAEPPPDEPVALPRARPGRARAPEGRRRRPRRARSSTARRRSSRSRSRPSDDPVEADEDRDAAAIAAYIVLLGRARARARRATGARPGCCAPPRGARRSASRTASA